MDNKSVEFEGKTLISCSIEETSRIVSWLMKNPKKIEEIKAAVQLEKEKETV